MVAAALQIAFDGVVKNRGRTAIVLHLKVADNAVDLCCLALVRHLKLAADGIVVAPRVMEPKY